MKKKYSLEVLIFLVFFLFSCKQQKEKILLPDLVHAEAVMHEYPDSALYILKSMDIPVPSDKFQNATWCLLMTQARDKNYMKHTSDSLINIAYDYFMRQDDPQRKAMALNYKGVVNEEAFGNIEKATKFYLEASKEVEKTKDYQLGYLIYRYLGNIYIFRHMPIYAMQAFQKAYKYAKLSNNKIYIAGSLSFIARIYSLQGDWSKTINHYEEAYHIAKSTGDERTISGIANELSNAYKQTNKYSLAMKYAQEALDINQKNHIKSGATLLTIGDIYRNTGNFDSAHYYFNKAILFGNVYTCRAAYQGLWYLNRDLTKDYKKALEYSGKFWIYTDSIQTIDKSKELIKIQEEFNQQKILNEKNQLQIEKDHTTNNALLGMTTLLCCIALIIYIYQRKLIQKERTIQKNKEQIRNYTTKIHENESFITRNESRIKELSIQIEENQGIQEQLEEEQTVLADIRQQNEALEQENISLQENIFHYSSLQEKNNSFDMLKTVSEENLRLYEREKSLCNKLIKKTEILNSLKKSPKYLDATHYEEVQAAIDEIYSDFTKRLCRQLPSLTESDLLFCCLIKLKLPISETAILLGISATSVSRKKSRLKERIIQDLKCPFGGDQTLDSWLWEY